MESLVYEQIRVTDDIVNERRMERENKSNHKRYEGL